MLSGSETSVLWLIVVIGRRRAYGATLDSDYAKARSNAKREGTHIRGEREEALSHLSTDDKSNINQSTRIPWIANLMASSKSYWGQICFGTAYDDEEAWKRYKEHLLHRSRTGLLVHTGTDRLTRDWELYFVENDKERLDGASLEDLCTYFNTPPPTSVIPSATASGLRSDVFLFADACAISQDVIASDPALKGRVHPPGAPFDTEHLIRGYVNAVDASYDPAKEYAHGFRGFLKVHPAHTATTVYHGIKVPGEEQEHGAEGWWKLKQSWETMFECANGSGGRKVGVYLPI